MYSRYPNYRFANGVRVPDNYSGNAFIQTSRDNDEKEEIKQETEPEAEERVPERGLIEINAEAEPKTVPVAKKIKLPEFNFGLGKIFSGKFGFEELLLIGLIFLVTQSENNDDDTILLLLLLLFIS